MPKIAYIGVSCIDQLSELGFIVNKVIVWNTKYMEVAIDSLMKTGHDISNEEIQRLSPLGYEHIIMGRYDWRRGCNWSNNCID